MSESNSLRKSKGHYCFAGKVEFILHGESLYWTAIDNDFDPEGNRYGQVYAMTLEEHKQFEKYRS